MIDVAAGVVAARHAGGPCVTISAEYAISSSFNLPLTFLINLNDQSSHLLARDPSRRSGSFIISRQSRLGKFNGNRSKGHQGINRDGRIVVLLSWLDPHPIKRCHIVLIIIPNLYSLFDICRQTPSRFDSNIFLFKPILSLHKYPPSFIFFQHYSQGPYQNSSPLNPAQNDSRK